MHNRDNAASSHSWCYLILVLLCMLGSLLQLLLLLGLLGWLAVPPWAPAARPSAQAPAAARAVCSDRLVLLPLRLCRGASSAGVEQQELYHPGGQDLQQLLLLCSLCGRISGGICLRSGLPQLPQILLILLPVTGPTPGVQRGAEGHPSCRRDRREDPDLRRG